MTSAPDSLVATPPPHPATTAPPHADRIVALWAAAGPIALLASALWRLAPRSADALAAISSRSEALVVLAASAAMIWLEGHRGFHRRVVPDIAARVTELAWNARGWRAGLAPLVACELVGAPAPRMRRRWMLVGGVVAAMLLIRALPTSMRGAVTVSVFCGLGWGFGSLLLTLRSLASPGAALASPAHSETAVTPQAAPTRPASR